MHKYTSKVAREGNLPLQTFPPQKITFWYQCTMLVALPPQYYSFLDDVSLMQEESHGVTVAT